MRVLTYPHLIDWSQFTQEFRGPHSERASKRSDLRCHQPPKKANACPSFSAQFPLIQDNDSPPVNANQRTPPFSQPLLLAISSLFAFRSYTPASADVSSSLVMQPHTLSHAHTQTHSHRPRCRPPPLLITIVKVCYSWEDPHWQVRREYGINTTTQQQ